MIARLFVILVAGAVLPYSFLSALCREIGQAFKSAWLEMLCELPSIRRAWRAKSIRPEKW
ncbi:hypothetical protein [Agrobacterium tumefaciens]|uniref:hypothetical protein n=1 Tax=Agrobacterium tumefaciens TaxID=358 RepID=UPI0015730B77|nr:hypothetical protein [Agrobacterium tumefaciens]NTB01592.1 hypothetical protein [Agrobacterium tumefaciens]